MRHSRTVARYALMIAEEVSLPEDSIEHLRLAAVLHDVGKIGIPDSVLRKPGPLTPDEWVLMRKHPQIGAQILEAAGLYKERDFVVAHHERPDGRGYPRGLAGDAIPTEALILSVADAYETMTSDRPYRESIGHEKACAELRKQAGAQFDEGIVDAFLQALKARGTADERASRGAAKRVPGAADSVSVI